MFPKNSKSPQNVSCLRKILHIFYLLHAHRHIQQKPYLRVKSQMKLIYDQILSKGIQFQYVNPFLCRPKVLHIKECSKFKSPVYINCTSIIFNVYFCLGLSGRRCIKISQIFYTQVHLPCHGIQEIE